MAQDPWTVRQANDTLESLGFLVAPVRQPPVRKHADLRATCDRNEYLVEVGHRLPSGRWLEVHDAVDAFGCRAIDRELRPVFADRIRTAERHLAATPAAADVIRLGWFVAQGDDEYALSCVEACLLGTRSVQLPHHDLDCYGFAHSEFSRCTDLHAAVLENESGITLLVNPFSRALEHVRRSSLYAELAARGAAIDPEVEVAAGQALMIGTDFVGQRDGRAQWEYLRSKYGQLACR